MKNKYLLFAAFMLSLTSFSQQLISTNTTWSGNIFISQQVVVQQGVTLTIAPGTNVSVGYTDVDGNGVGDVKIIVKGRLKVNSNACNPVKFGPYTSTTDKKYWSGITINSNLNNDSIQGIQILNADTALKVRTASTITSSLIENFGSVGVNFIPNIPNTNLFLRNLIIKRGNTGILADSSGSKLQLDWCSVDSCSNGVLSMNSKITMNSCVVKNSKLLGIATMDGEVDCYNSIIKGNYVFGVFNSSGTINVNNCDISLNTLGGILCAGNSLSNVKYSNIQNNIGAQFETTNYKFGLNTSGGYQSIYDGNPIINANYNNILGDTLTTAIDSLGLFDMNSTASGICWASPIPAAGICSQWGTNACGDVGAMGINSSLIYKTVLGRLAAFWVSHNFGAAINALSRCYSLNLRDEGSLINLGGTGACVSPYVYLQVCLSNPNQGGVFNVLPTYEQDKYLNINCNSISTSFLVSSATNKAYYKFGGDLLFNDIRPVPNVVSPSFNFQNNNFGQPNLTNYFFDQTNQSFDYSGYSIFPIIGAGINLGSNLLQNSNFPSAFLKTSTGLDTVCGSISGFTISTDFVNGATYKWYYNGNLFQNTSTNTYQIPVAGQWSCEIITPTCTLRTGVRNIVIQQLPAISISGNTTVCQGESVTLNASGASNFLWSNGSTQSSITFTPSANTNINLSGNENGCTANTTVSIIVNAVPNPSISPSPSAILCAGGQLQLTAAGGTNYIWSNGSNGGSINVNSAGVYTVTAISSDNCSAVSSPVTVVTVTGISVTITPSNSNICSGQSTTLSANGGSTYNWSNGSTSSNIIVSPNQTTTYSVTGTSSNGCSNSAQVTVTVNSLPTASTISAGGNTTFCAGGSVTLSGNNGGTWSNGSASPSINVTTAGTYSVTNTNSCGSATSNQIAVTVNPLPTASTISAGGNTTFCTGGSITLSGNNGGTWSNGSASPSINVTASGTYSVTNTNSCGSVTSNQVAVTVNPLPTASTISAGGNTTFCAGGSVMLSGNNGGTWSNGSASPSINVTASGTYSVTNTNSCGSATSNQIAVTVNPLPTASTIAAGGNTTFCAGGSVTLSGNNGGTWSNGSASPSINVSASGTYSVTNTNSCGSATSNQIAVTVNANPSQPVITQNGNVLTASNASSYQWQFNGVDIAGATQQQHIALQDGNYTVYITDSNSCSNSSTSLNVILTAIKTVQNPEQDFIVYPNPAKDVLNIISISKSDIIDIKLYDVLGKEVQLHNIETGIYNNTKAYTMSIKHLQSGVYFVKLGNTMKRFVCE